MKHICFVLDSYPTKTNNGCVFAKHLIWAIADKGYKCTVIAPKIVTPSIIKKRKDYIKKRTDVTDKGNQIDVYTPFYLHLSSKKVCMKKSMDNHYRSVTKTLKKNNIHPDVIYGHFIYQCGLTAARIGKDRNIPSYCACGENSLRLEKDSQPYCIGLKYCGWYDILSLLSGIVSVSTNNSNLLIDNGFVDRNKKMGVFPNGINNKKFFVMNKELARDELSLPKDKFIVAFTGTFKASKGVMELSEALKNCDDIYSLFMGKGDLKPDCKNILFCGSVPNDKLHLYLNAADVFVLPTKGEGCCNAIVEALACGLPVISSNLPFNDDILNETNSIRIDVTDVNQIESAIKLLKEDNRLYYELKQGAKNSADKLGIQTRAENILRFMELIQ